jgi:hypothetical protein
VVEAHLVILISSIEVNLFNVELIIENSNCLRKSGEDTDKACAKEKLKILAYQLGESCFASDLSALINQRRDLELEKMTKDKKNNFQKQKSDYINKLKNSDKIDTEFEDDKPHFHEKNIKTLINKKPLFKSTDDNKVSISQTMLDYTKEFKRNLVFSFENNVNTFNPNIDRNYKNYLKIREIISNFIINCLRDYSIDELQLLKINTNLIYSYLSLPTIENIRKKIERKVKYFNFSKQRISTI